MSNQPLFSLTIPDGWTHSTVNSHRPVSPRMLEKQTKTTQKNRKSQSTLIVVESNDELEHFLLSQVQGLIMAIKDPLVSLFAIMTISQLLGLSFVQYFPTLVDSHPSIVKYNDLIRGLGILKHLDLILPTLNFSLRRLTIFFYTLILFWFHSMYRPPWILASIICCMNSLHAGIERTYSPDT